MKLTPILLFALGIIDRVSHFTSLETKMVLLAPIFESPSLPRPDYQYSITNFIGIDSKLGSQSDFDELIETAKKNGKDSPILLNCTLLIHFSKKI